MSEELQLLLLLLLLLISFFGFFLTAGCLAAGFLAVVFFPLLATAAARLVFCRVEARRLDPLVVALRASIASAVGAEVRFFPLFVGIVEKEVRVFGFKERGAGVRFRRKRGASALCVSIHSGAARRMNRLR